jgi:2,4-dienoyl-CoA reductase-like NADH-dependent reductase (Old Yellow Enzyme family)
VLKQYNRNGQRLAVVCAHFGSTGQMEVGMQKSLKLSTLKRKGVDLIDVSSGALVPYQQIPVAPNYQVPFAEQIKKRKRNPN